MSYVSTTQIVHKCSGCGKKMPFVNTGKFRVNANGSKVDVWLIYQCAKCRHSLNLTIYERIRPGRIPEEDFQKFQENDEELAVRYGNDKEFLKKNKVEIKEHKKGEAV